MALLAQLAEVEAELAAVESASAESASAESAGVPVGTQNLAQWLFDPPAAALPTFASPASSFLSAFAAPAAKEAKAVDALASCSDDSLLEMLDTASFSSVLGATPAVDQACLASTSHTLRARLSGSLELKRAKEEWEWQAMMADLDAHEEAGRGVE